MRRRSPRARLGQVKSEGSEYLSHGEAPDGHDTKRGVKRSLGDGAPMSSLDALAAGRGGARCDARALPHTVMTRFMEAWLAERLRERMAGDSDFEGEEKSMNDLLDSLSVRTISTTEESIDMEPEVRRGFDLRRPHPHAPPTWLEYVLLMDMLFSRMLLVAAAVVNRDALMLLPLLVPMRVLRRHKRSLRAAGVVDGVVVVVVVVAVVVCLCPDTIPFSRSLRTFRVFFDYFGP